MNRYLVTYNAFADGSPEGFRGHVLSTLEGARAFADQLALTGYRTRIWQQLAHESTPAEAIQRAIENPRAALEEPLP